MANQIRLKRGTGSDPSASDLVTGELALRTDNGALFTKKDDGSLREIGPVSGASDLVNDTTPQLGGDLDTNNNNINLGDDDKISFGTGSDNNLEIFHESTSDTNEIIAADGDIHIQCDNFQLISDDSGGRAIFLNNSGGHLELGFDGNHDARFAGNQVTFLTNVDCNSGLDVTGDITASAQVTANSSSSEAGFISKGDGSSTDGYIQLNCSQNSHGIKLSSPAHSAAQSYTFTFPSSIVNNGVLKTDGSANTSFGLVATANIADNAVNLDKLFQHNADGFIATVNGLSLIHI